MNEQLNKKEFGAEIARLRKLKGYSQEYMAIQLGIDASTYSKKESGECGFSDAQLFKCSLILEFSVDELFQRVNPKEYAKSDMLALKEKFKEKVIAWLLNELGGPMPI